MLWLLQLPEGHFGFPVFWCVIVPSGAAQIATNYSILSVSVCLSVCLSLSLFPLSVCLSVCRFVSLSLSPHSPPPPTHRLLMKWRFEDRIAKQMEAVKKVTMLRLFVCLS